jgi:aspartyl-tRNA(Asn)/glutamyl-tRNA(Gln) amidotransferase subunit B
VGQGKISYSAASQKIYPELLVNPGKSPLEIAKSLNLLQESNTDSINSVIEEVLAAYPEKVAEYRNGKKGLLGMFMGEVMKKSKGKADPKVANELLRGQLD